MSDPTPALAISILSREVSRLEAQLAAAKQEASEAQAGAAAMREQHIKVCNTLIQEIKEDRERHPDDASALSIFVLNIARSALNASITRGNTTAGADLLNELATVKQERDELREALKPFAEAYEAFPEGERSVLYMWDSSFGEAYEAFPEGERSVLYMWDTFAEAYEAFPEGERSVLYMWDSSFGETKGVKLVEISTDTLRKASEALRKAANGGNQ